MKDLDIWLEAQARAADEPLSGAADAFAHRLALEPAPMVLESRRDLRRITACLLVAAVFGGATTLSLDALRPAPAAARWPAEALAVAPSSLLTLGGRG